MNQLSSKAGAAITIAITVVITLLAAWFVSDVFGHTDNVRVTDDGKVLIADRDNLPFRVSFPLPHNCTELTTEIDATLAHVSTASAASDAVQAKMAALIVLGGDLCSYNDWSAVQADQLTRWYDASAS